MTIDELWRAFSMKRNEVERRAGLSGRIVGSAQAMLEKVVHEFAAAARSVRSADSRFRQGTPHSSDGIVVELFKLRRRAAPVTDVRLVLNFPVPTLSFGFAISCDRMLRPLISQLFPLLIILGWICPAGEDLFVLRRRGPMMLIWIGLRRECLRHKSNLHVRPETSLTVRVEYAIENGPVVN